MDKQQNPSAGSHTSRVTTEWPDSLKAFFFAFWAFFGIYYGDVLYIAQQYSFFSTAQGAMRPLWETSYGSLWIIGRALLQAFHSPFWGGALLSGMLTLISWLSGYVFRLRGRFGYLKYIPAFVFIYVAVYHGFDIYYQAETGKLLGIPFCILLILACQAAFVRSFSRKRLSGLFTPPAYNRPIDEWKAMGFILVLGAGAVGMNEWYRPYVRPTASMQRDLERRDWKGMQATASRSSLAYGTVDAYHAISRMEGESGAPKVAVGMLPPASLPIYLHDREGNHVDARNYFMMDYCIASGQYPVAYERGKADLKANGPSPLLLKQMVRVCLALHKKEEARSHLNVLRTLPFEEDFIETYAPRAQE